MPAADSPALIVARYLKSSNYTESLEAFIAEAGLPPDAGETSKDDLTIEALLEEKKTFDVAVRFEKLGVEDAKRSWSIPDPISGHVMSTLPAQANVLSVQVERLDTSTVLLATMADTKLHIIDAANRSVKTTISALHDSPILSCTVLKEQYFLTASMSGHLIASTSTGAVLDKRKDHNKYIVKITTFTATTSDHESLIATAGWDNKVCIYKPDITPTFKFNDPITYIDLPTKPEAMLFIQHPDTAQPLLLISRTDSSCLFYYTTTDPPTLLGKQNLAPHSNAWVAFTPSSLALHPHDPTLLAIGTSSVPHMKLLIARLLFPPLNSSSMDSSRPLTQTSQARAALAVADREAAAILIHATTLAPQTAYSTPAVAWRPDGTGVWVNGDDGAVRGIEACSGKVVRTLTRGGHEAGSKVRCLCTGLVGEEGEEVLVSGGFDRRLVLWRGEEA